MAYKILSVSIIEDKIDILKLEMGVTNAFTAVGKPQPDVNQKALGEAAQWADEIRINADFPSTEYQWNIFPKVGNRILKQLVNRHAAQALETRQGARVAFQDQGTTMIDGMSRRKVSYVAVNEEEVFNWEHKTFVKHYKKIRRVTPLPVALSAAVVQSERPKNDFMVVWAGEMSAIFVVSSSRGDVKVARNIPVGLDRDDLVEDDYDVLESFSQEFDRDIMTTLLLYNDTFEEPACENFYLLGNVKLKAIFEQFPLQSVGDHSRFSLHNLAIRGLNDNDRRAYHLQSNLFISRDYNLVDSRIIWGQRFDKGYKFATMILVGCIATASAWILLTTSQGKVVNKDLYEVKMEQLEQLKKELYQLETKEIELKRFDGWKNFYKNTYTNQPAWSEMFSSLADTIPEQFVLNKFEIYPGQDAGIHGWRCRLSGHIKAVRWNLGLRLLREFGAKVHQSPYYEIIDVQYTPLDDDKSVGSHETSFDFVIQMKLTSQEKK